LPSRCGPPASPGPDGQTPSALLPILDPAPLPPGPSLIGIDAPVEPADPLSIEELGLEELFDDAADRAAGCDIAAWYRALPVEDAVTAARLAIAKRLLEDAGARQALTRATDATAEARALVPRKGADRSEDRRWLAALLSYGAALSHYAEGIAALPSPTSGATSTRDAALRAIEARRARLGPTLRAAALLAQELDRVRSGLVLEGDLLIVKATSAKPFLADELRRLLRPLLGDADQPPIRRSQELPRSGLAALVVEEIARQHPVLEELRALRAESQGFLDPWVLGLERECRFFLAYLGAIEARCKAPRRISIPTFCPAGTPQSITDGWEVGLARTRSDLACSSLSCEPARSLVVLTGPNGAGKTTFARMVGQVAYLGALGLPVPAAGATLARPRRVDAIFSRPESLTDQGRLGQELDRLIDLLGRPGPRVLVANEVFASTTTHDALALAASLLARLEREGALAVVVTFLDELADHEGTTSLVATGPPRFDIVEGPPSAASSALALAAQYRLRAADISARIHP